MKSIIICAAYLPLVSVSIFSEPKPGIPAATEAKKLTDKSEIRLREQEKVRFTRNLEYQITNCIYEGKYYCYVILPDDKFIFTEIVKELEDKGYEFRLGENNVLYIIWGEVSLSKELKKVKLKDLIK